MRVTIQRTVGRSDAEQLLALYRASIAALEPVAAGVQALTDDDFRAQLRNKGVLKLVARDRDGHPRALSLVTTDLSLVPWISPKFFATQFPEHYERDAIVYVSVMVVQPSSQSSGWAYVLMKEITRLCAARDGICAFDCCGVAQEIIPDLALLVSNQLGDIERLEIDSQRFYAYRAHSWRPEALAEAGTLQREIDLRARHEEEEEEEVVDLVALEQDEQHADDRSQQPESGT